MARRQPSKTNPADNAKTRIGSSGSGKNIKRERRHKTAERERMMRSDRTRLCILGRDYALVPPNGSTPTR